MLLHEEFSIWGLELWVLGGCGRARGVGVAVGVGVGCLLRV